jgi:hypothetical protein
MDAPLFVGDGEEQDSVNCRNVMTGDKQQLSCKTWQVH